jgi:hypothetical protein
MVLAEIGVVAGILGNGTNIIDKIYTRFFEMKTGQTAAHGVTTNFSEVIRNDPAQGALVRESHGRIVQKVTYDELAQRLKQGDRRYIQTREKVMMLLYDQWEAAYPELATETNPIRKKQLRQQLDGVTGDLAKELDAVLDFIAKSGLHLDDHYMHFRHVASARSS